jgi:hypothetical protein
VGVLVESADTNQPTRKLARPLLLDILEKDYGLTITPRNIHHS